MISHSQPNLRLVVCDRYDVNDLDLDRGRAFRCPFSVPILVKPLLDEPTLGLDILGRRELWSVIENLKGEITIILTTHYLEEAEALADEIGIMVRGRLKALGTAEHLTASIGARNFEDAFVALATDTEAIL